jgi:hypothetical protein
MTIRKNSGIIEGRRVRVRRIPPARTVPLRKWSGALKGSGSWKPEVPLAADAREGSESHRTYGAIDGVKLGYSVIEQHMRRAESVARQYRSRQLKESPTRGADFQEAVARVFRSVADLVPLLGEIINAAGAVGFNQNLPFGSSAGTGNHAERGGFLEANSRVDIALSSLRHATATLELRPGADRLPLLSTGLYASGIEKPVVKRIEFSSGTDGKKALLRIRVPRGRVGAIYCGLLFDRGSGEAQGVLTVRVVK